MKLFQINRHKQLKSIVWIVLGGIANILDGVVCLISLGFIHSNFKYYSVQITLAFYKWCGKRKI